MRALGAPARVARRQSAAASGLNQHFRPPDYLSSLSRADGGAPFASRPLCSYLAQCGSLFLSLSLSLSLFCPIFTSLRQAAVSLFLVLSTSCCLVCRFVSSSCRLARFGRHRSALRPEPSRLRAKRLRCSGAFEPSRAARRRCRTTPLRGSSEETALWAEVWRAPESRRTVPEDAA